MLMASHLTASRTRLIFVFLGLSLTGFGVACGVAKPHPSVAGTTALPASSTTSASVTPSIPVVPVRCRAAKDVVVKDCVALDALYEAAGGKDWPAEFDWSASDPCVWYGITCENGRVVAISLNFQDRSREGHLKGTLPPEIGDLAFLRSLSIVGDRSDTGSGLTGIPHEIGLLHRLQFIDLDHNSISIVPPDLGRLAMLSVLDLSNNHLANVPVALEGLTGLKSLFLGNNQLGEMSAELVQRLVHLVDLGLQGNQLTTLPAGIENLGGLESLDVSSNQLSILPPAVGALSNLTELHLSGNHLQALPEEIGNLASLQELDVEANDLETLPTSIPALRSLRRLRLSGNRLLRLPSGLGELSDLEHVEAANNRLEEIPSSLATLKHLKWLTLANNKITSDVTALISMLQPRPGIFFDGNNMGCPIVSDSELAAWISKKSPAWNARC
jgi:Leucine rich repeat